MELINSIDETFKFEDKEVRIIGTYNEPWFVAKDICDILELSNTTNALRNIPEKWMTLQNVKSSYNSQNMIILKEPAVYQLVMRSTKPIAKKFQEVVCEDILPTLRKKGEYKIKTIIDKNKELEDELYAKEIKICNLQNQNKIIASTIKRKIEEKNKVGKCLYFVSNPEIKGKFKCGHTEDIDKRITGLSTGSPTRFEILDIYYTDSYVVLEETLKKFFSKYRITQNCEWYDLEIIDRMREFVNDYIKLFEKFSDCSEFDEDVINEIEIIEEETVSFNSKKCENCHENIIVKDNYFLTKDGSCYLDMCKTCFQIENMKGNDCKQCKECKEIKYLYDFTIDRHTRDGLSCNCKSCAQIIRTAKKEENDYEKILPKKKCITCETYKYSKMFFQTGKEEETIIYSEQCKDCYNEHNGEHKQCFRCKDIKKVFHFNNASQNIDGYSGTCKQCLQKQRDENSKKRKEIHESERPGEKKCTKCNESLKFLLFFKVFQSGDKDNFIYNDECRKCYTPNSLQCNKCCKIKIIDEFGIDKGKTTGRRTICKDCTNERDRNRRAEYSKPKI